jgi:hypothetical protein
MDSRELPSVLEPYDADDAVETDRGTWEEG